MIRLASSLPVPLLIPAPATRIRFSTSALRAKMTDASTVSSPTPGLFLHHIVRHGRPRTIVTRTTDASRRPPPPQLFHTTRLVPRTWRRPSLRRASISSSARVTPSHTP